MNGFSENSLFQRLNLKFIFNLVAPQCQGNLVQHKGG